jgi:predicted permease
LGKGLENTPPRLATALLRRCLGDDFETIAGDLEEIFGADIAPRASAWTARLWYWRQVVSVIRARLFAREESSVPPVKRATMAAFRQDLSYALRALRQQPGFTGIAVLTLALGIGANVAVFSVVNAVLFKSLPFADPEQLMAVHLSAPDREAPGVYRTVVWSYPKYQVLREHQRVFQSTAIFTGSEWSITGTGTPERLSGEVVEASYFSVLGVMPRAGRSFSADDTRAPGSAPLAMLGHGLWQRRFGADPNAIGRTIGLNGIAHTIVGILPPGFRGLTGRAEVWVPVMTLPADHLAEIWSHSYSLVARRKSDVSPEQAQAAVKVLGDQINAQYSPRTVDTTSPPWGATAVPMNNERVDPLIRRSILLMLAAVGSVLLIVCVNLANLMLVRALARQREVAIRLALGASRLRIVRQLMTESLLLAAAGTLAGLAVAYGVIVLGARLMPDLRMVLTGPTAGLTRVGLGTLGLDGTTLLFTLAIALGTAAIFGLGPAWRASRRDLTTTMRAGSPGAVSQSHAGFSVRNLLIVGEMALALVLLTAGGLMLKSVARLQATELGFQPESLFTFRLALPSPQYNPSSATLFLEQLLERLRTQGDIRSVGYGNCAPVSRGCNVTIATFPDRPASQRGNGPQVGIYWASPDYFDTLGIRLIRGRVFDARDRIGQPKVVVINETAARTFWGPEDPIGKRIGLGQGGFHEGAEVVGIVADVRYGAVERTVSPDAYIPLLQSARSGGLIFVRSQTTLERLIPLLRREVAALDTDLPLIDFKTMDQRFGDATWRTRTTAWLLAAFASLALVLAAIGIYGVMAQTVAQRVREIGVRMALGATRADIFRLILGRACLFAIAGVVAGIVFAIPSMRLLTALLYQVRPADPLVMATLALMVLIVAVFASYLPARRAARVDPLTTLRAE